MPPLGYKSLTLKQHVVEIVNHVCKKLCENNIVNDISDCIALAMLLTSSLFNIEITGIHKTTINTIVKGYMLQNIFASLLKAENFNIIENNVKNELVDIVALKNGKVYVFQVSFDAMSEGEITKFIKWLKSDRKTKKKDYSKVNLIPYIITCEAIDEDIKELLTKYNINIIDCNTNDIITCIEKLRQYVKTIQ